MALFVEIPSIFVLLAFDVFDPFHRHPSGLALHVAQVGIVALLASIVLSLIGFFFDKEKGATALAFCVPIILFLLVSIGY